jgi:hypothetical protein
MAAGVIFGTIGFLIAIPSLYHGAFPDLNARNVDISFNNVLFVVEKLTTIALFCGKSVFTALRHPGCYVNIKPRLNGERMSAGELRKRLGTKMASVKGLAGVASLNRGGRGRGRDHGRGRA